MNRAVILAGVVAVFAGIGGMNLARMNRGGAAEVKEAEARLAAVPTRIGDWVAADAPVNEKSMKIAEAQAYLSRTYTRGRSGPAVNLLVLYGDPGPLGAHTPEVCYGAAGYTQVGAANRRTIPDPDGGPADALWTARFDSAGFPRSGLQLAWGWGPSGRWAAADNPRVEFVAHSRIYKLYMSRAVSPTARPDDPDPTEEFVGPFLRAFRAAVTGPAPADDSIPPAPRTVARGPGDAGSPGAATP